METFPDEEDKAYLLGKKAEPHNKEIQKNIKSFFRTIGVYLGLAKDYTAEDLTSLKNAGVSMVESKADIEKAKATKTMAEATEKHANAEARKLEAKGKFMKDKADAFATVISAIESIKAKGGNVSFDVEQIERLLESGGNKYLEEEE